MSITTLGFGAGIGLIALVAVVAYGHLSSLAESQRWVLHTHEVVERSQALALDLADAGRARRAFAQGRDEAELAPYRDAVARVTEAQRVLRRLTADSPAQQPLLDQIDRVIATRFEHLERAIRDARAHAFDAPTELALADAAVVLTKELAELVARFDAAEQQLLEDRTAAMGSEAESVKRAIIVGFLASIAILGFAFLQSRHEIRRRLRELVERRAIEMDLQQLAAIVDSSDDAIIAVTLDGKVTAWNASAEQMLGHTAREMIGTSIATILPESMLDDEHGRLAAIVRGEKVPPFEATRRRKDGTLVDVSIRLSPILAAGQVIGASKVVRDISARKRIEAIVQRVNAHLLSAVDAIEDAFALYDEQDRVVLVNGAFRQLFQLSAEGPIAGRTFEALLDAGLAAGVYELGTASREDYRAHRLAAHRHPAGVFELRTTDGRILRGTEQRTPEGGTVSLYVDVTADVAREDELRLARSEADASNAAKSEFLSSMSHELRTPLNAILGFTELLLRDRKEPLGRRHLERLERIASGGQHLMRLVDDVLDFAKIEAGRIEVAREPVDLVELVRDLASTLAPMASARGITLTVAPVTSGIVTTVVADRRRTSQVLMNFGSNAIKYGRDRGQVTLQIDRSGDRVRVAVSDDGIGIPADAQARIFEPFHRAGQETGSIEGTGIGLTISKRLVEMMDGRIGFTSEVGRGSTFWLELPEARAAQDPLRVAPAAITSPLASVGPRELIVYVEDNPSNIALMEALIDDLPRLELITARTAERGLELIRTHKPKVVIMDVNLPGMSGIEATRKLAELPETREIQVIGLSAAALPADAERARATGFYRYLTKPVKLAELTSVLEEILL